jgi:hypothetical protein
MTEQEQANEVDAVEEFGDVFEMSDDEKALLERLESGEPEPEPTQEPPAPEPPAPAPEPPAPELPPVAEPPPIPPPAAAEIPPAAPERFELPDDRDPTNAELGRYLRQMQEDTASHNKGMRDEMIRERERRRVAESIAATQPPATADGDALPPTPEEIGLGAATPEEGIPVVIGEDGSYVVDKEKLAEFIQSAGQKGAPAPGRAPVGAPQVSDTQNQAFEMMRSSLVAESEDPTGTMEAVDSLRGALLWLDQRVAQETPRYADRVPVGRGLDSVDQLLNVSGIKGEFAKAYPGVDPMELVEVGLTLEPFKTRRLVDKYMKGRVGAPPPASSDPVPPAAAVPPASSLDQGRPPPMSGRGNVASPTPAAKDYARLSHDDVLGLSDEEFKEMEKLAMT